MTWRRATRTPSGPQSTGTRRNQSTPLTFETSVCRGFASSCPWSSSSEWCSELFHFLFGFPRMFMCSNLSHCLISWARSKTWTGYHRHTRCPLCIFRSLSAPCSPACRYQGSSFATTEPSTGRYYLAIQTISLQVMGSSCLGTWHILRCWSLLQFLRVRNWLVGILSV